MKKLKIIIRCIISVIINTITYTISLFIPKSEQIWVFGGWFGKRFADNSRYLYLYCNEHKEELDLEKVIWITDSDEIHEELKSKGFEVYKKWSLKSIWYHFRAKVVFVDQGPNDVNKWFCIRMIKINLWHGFALKKIGALCESIDFSADNVYDKYFKIGGWSNYYLQASSELSKEILSKAFCINHQKIIVSGYSRNEVFSQKYEDIYISDSEKNALQKIEGYRSKGYKIIFYLPTFRDNNSINLLNIKTEQDKKRISEYLTNNKVILVTKLHFAQSGSTLERGLSNTINLESNVDVYQILKYSDILITDYSSVYFDFLLTNKPVIFYPFDIDDYKDDSKGRGLLFDYEEFTPGVKVFNIDELLESIKYVMENTEIYNKQYEKQRKLIIGKAFDNNIDNGSSQLLQKIRKI